LKTPNSIALLKDNSNCTLIKYDLEKVQQGLKVTPLTLNTKRRKPPETCAVGARCLGEGISICKDGLIVMFGFVVT